MAASLIAFQGYLGYSVVTGQFGIESQDALEVEIDELQARSAALQAELEVYRQRVALFDPSRLDPDIVSERARALLSMAQPDDVIIIVDPASGKPVISSSTELSEIQLIDVIEDGVD